MTDAEIILQFESGEVAPASFHHADHVRLAFAYLSQSPVLEALQRFADALKNFAAANGKPQLYHETLTFAFFFLIRERMERSPAQDWECFERANPDLFTWKNGVLARYYSDSTLESDFARRVFVLPDISRSV